MDHIFDPISYQASLTRRYARRPPRWGRFWQRSRTKHGCFVLHHLGSSVELWYYLDGCSRGTFCCSWDTAGFTLIERRWKEFLVPSFLKRFEGTPAEKSKAAKCTDAHFAKSYPAVAEYLTAIAYPDGQQRATAAIYLFFEGGRFRASLNDRDQELVVWADSDTFVGLLEALEGLVSDSKCPWRAKPERNGKAGKGPKRT